MHDEHGKLRSTANADAVMARKRPLAIVGARGTLGRAFAQACAARGLGAVLLERSQLDLTRPECIAGVLESVRPWAVINTAGFVRVDLAEREVERCMAINATGAAALAQVCLRLGIRLLTFSSDLVFDGAQSTPYLESDPVAPLSVYGQSKVQAEQLVGRLLEDALIVRTSAFFGPEDAANFVTMTLSALLRGERVRAASDVTISPTYVPHLTHACLELLIDGASGIWHLANQGALSWHELAERAGRLLGVSLEGLDPCRFADLQLPAPRPSNSVLSSERAQLMPTLDEGLADYASHVASQFRGQARPRGDLNTDMA